MRLIVKFKIEKMKIPFFKLTILVTLLLTISCNKENDDELPTSVKGQVRIYGTENPLHKGLPIDITLMEQYTPHDGAPIGSGGSAYREIATVTTDSLGYFSFNFKGKSSPTFYLEPQSVPEPYRFSVDLASLLDKYSVIPGQNQTKHIYMYAPGWLQLSFINQGPVHVGDFISYNLGSGTDGRVYGPTENNPDAMPVLRISGNVDQPVAFNLFRNGEWSSWKEYYFIPAFDTALYEVNY